MSVTRVQSLPGHTPSGCCAQGLPTRAQLGEQWTGVAAQTQRLAKLPHGSGGLLSLAAAGLAARLKVLLAQPRCNAW